MKIIFLINFKNKKSKIIREMFSIVINFEYKNLIDNKWLNKTIKKLCVSDENSL